MKDLVETFGEELAQCEMCNNNILTLEEQKNSDICSECLEELF